MAKESKKQQEAEEPIVDGEPTTSTSTEETGESAADPAEEIQALKEQNLRLYAEFENFRRRNARERLDLMATANE